ncbi:MAG: VOC family protein [Anaerolineales bacterium]|nr:VOC family protein [Anaerolineales bacterium]
MITGINHITLAVRDIERSFRFYRDALGFQPVQKSPQSAYFVIGELWLALVQDKKARHSCLPEYTHIAFTVDPEDFTAVRERLIAAGVQEWQQNWTMGESFYFTDPNGHKLEIHASNLEARIEDAKIRYGAETEWFV